MRETHLYDIYDYGCIIADTGRTGAYARALRQSVKPGSIVLDIGTGVGIWALLACQAGARKVYAVDPNDAALELAREIAVANGYADRIEFIQDIATEIAPPELADVVVSELRGVLPLSGESLPTLIDARKRLLVPGGVMIPQCDTLWAAVVESPDLHSRHTIPWRESLSARHASRTAGGDQHVRQIQGTGNAGTPSSGTEELGDHRLRHAGEREC